MAQNKDALEVARSLELKLEGEVESEEPAEEPGVRYNSFEGVMAAFGPRSGFKTQESWQ